MTTTTKIQKHRLAGGFEPAAYTYVDQFDHRQNEVMDPPSKLGEAQVGDVVRFKATFSKSNDDDKFAFFKRPTVSK